MLTFNLTPTSNLDFHVLREENSDFNALFDADYPMSFQIYVSIIGSGVASLNTKLTKPRLTQTYQTPSDLTTGVQRLVIKCAVTEV